MRWREDEILWRPADAPPVRIGATRFGEGPQTLLLPALSSISSRAEMRPLQERLGARRATMAVDWPGFGDLPRPAVDWRPERLRAFLRFLLEELPRPETTIAAGHATGYVLAEAAENPGALGRLRLLSPTWRGPLPTMAGRRLGLFRAAIRAADAPYLGAAFYRLNVNGPVIRMMARGHVYSDPGWLTPERMAEKRRVVEAPGARRASFRFVAGELDLFHDREAFLATARRVEAGALVIRGGETPRKSGTEMEALAALPRFPMVETPRGKLSFYEEFPEATAALLFAGEEEA